MSRNATDITVHFKDGTEQDYTIEGRFWAYGEFYCFRAQGDIDKHGKPRVTYLSGNVVDRITSADRVAA